MNRNATLILVVVFAALLVYVLVVQNPADKAKQAGTPTPSAAATAAVNQLWPTLKADQILSVQVQDQAAKRSVAFGRTAAAANWAVTEPKAGPADQLLAASKAAGLVDWSYDSAITTSTDLSAFGILSPTYIVTVQLVDGSALKATIGDKTPTGDSYYVARNGDKSVLVMASFTIKSLTDLLDTPPYLQPTATSVPTDTVPATGATTGAPSTPLPTVTLTPSSP